MTRIVVNTRYGGFSLSHQAFLELRARGLQEALDEPDYGEFYRDGSGPRKAFGRGRGDFLYSIRRDHPVLVALINERGSEWVSGELASLEVVEIPDDVEWRIEDYDGQEWVAEQHRTWFA